MEVKILVCHHKKSPYIKNECFVPIHVGKEISNVDLPYCISDNEGDNISAKNKSWCELTALYWAWKNLDADYYGLMHYRRYLNFNQNDGGYSIFNDINNDAITEYGWEPELVKEKCKKFDIITAPEWNIHPVGLNHMVMNAYDFYAKEHYRKDMDVVIDIVKNDFPQFYFPLLDSLSNRTCFFGNIAIMKAEYFNEYCSFLFGVLSKAEEKIDISDYDSYQYRIWGFIAERLINCYKLYAQSRYKNIKIGSLGIAFGAFDKPELRKQEIKNETRCIDDVINICMSFDDNYVSHADAAITSIIHNSHSDQKIDIYVLCDEKLSSLNRNKLSLNRRNNVSIKFLDIDPGIFSSLPLNRAYISLNTYYRLIIHKILPSNITKAIYIDSDVIVNSDISELWSISIDGYCIAGCYDEGGVLQSRRLSLNNNNYINAGVIVFNIKEINRQYKDVFFDYFELYYKYKELITLQDQDIINITYLNRIKIIPLKWNVNSRMFTYNDLDHKYSISEATNAVNNIGILHFTDRKKPWKITCTHPLKNIYWKYRALGNYSSLSFDEKIIQKTSGIFSYEISGAKINITLGNKVLKMNKSFVAYVYKHTRWLTRKII